MKNILPILLFAISLAFSGCRNSAKNYPVTFVDRMEFFSPDKKPNPLLLVVEIRADGKLSLNKIETGNINDPTDLTTKIEAVFDDRKKASIGEREVVISPNGGIEKEELDTLIQSLADVQASPIRVIINNP